MSMATMYENSTTVQQNYSRADLQALNNERAMSLLPAMFVLGILMIVGIVGNSLVCYIFCCQLKSGTQNFLIVCLAVFDLLSCLIAIPNEIADMRYYFIFESTGACKIMRFLNSFCAIGSIFTLVVIAVDRYRKICKPFHGQMHMTHVRLSLIPIFGGALFFGWPAFVMYGLRTTETGVPGLLGQDCSTPDGISDTVYPLLYNCILFLCFIILAVTLIILYTFVLRETRRHNRYLKRNSDFNLPSSGQYNSEDSHSSLDAVPGNAASPSLPSSSDETTNRNVQFEFGSNCTVDNTVKTAVSVNVTTSPISPAGAISTDAPPVAQPKLISVSQLVDSDLDESSNQILTLDHDGISSIRTSNKTVSYTDSSLPSEHNDIHPSSHSPNLATRSSLSTSNGSRTKDNRTVLFNESTSTKRNSSIKKRRRFKSKTTMIAFLVTLVFILSFLPHLSLQVTKLLHKGFDYNLQGSGLVTYNIFLRSYFVNSVSNPFIYGALNVHFSKEVRLAIRRLCRQS